MKTISTKHTDPSPIRPAPLDEAGYASAIAKARRLLDADPATPLDAVIHGVRVRLYTTNSHWRQFWSANWFAPDQWATLTGQVAPGEPRVHLYATTPEAGETPQASHSRAHNAAFLWGATPYGPLRALTLHAVARLLAEEEAVHFVPGLCLKENDQGVLLLRPPNVDPATAVPLLLEKAQAHLAAFDGVFIRYGLVRMVDGVTLLPTLIIDEKGNQIPGYRLFPWLEAYGYWEPRADARCLTLACTEEYCFARDLDLGRPPEAFAYPLEQAWYVPTQIVAARPGLVGRLWHVALENVPPLTPELLDRFGAWARQATASLLADADTSARPLLEQASQEQVVEALCRLRAAPQARAVVPLAQLWPGRAGGHPWRPLQIERVALLGDDAPLRPGMLAQALSGGGEDEIARTLTNLLERATLADAS